jgi:hypothetical protein
MTLRHTVTRQSVTHTGFGLVIGFIAVLQLATKSKYYYYYYLLTYLNCKWVFTRWQ